jgi:hypothetical protein
MVRPLIQQALAGRAGLYSQFPSMNDRQKREFLDRVTSTGNGRSHLGLAVLGGLFGEGVDLPGEQLVNSKTEEAIARKLGRTAKGVHLKAKRLGLGGQIKGSHYLTAQNIANIMGIDIHAVLRWIETGLIKFKLARVDRKVYLIEVSDLETFLENNQNLWNCRKLKGTLWLKEPDWLKEKRAADNHRPVNECKKWTPDEDKIALDLYRKGLKLKDIGLKLGRSHEGVERRIHRLFERADLSLNI